MPKEERMLKLFTIIGDSLKLNNLSIYLSIHYIYCF